MKKGWASKRLGEVCAVSRYGKAPEGSAPYVEIGDIDVESKQITSKKKGAVKGSVLAPAGSVLVSRVRPTRGAISILEEDSAVSSAFTILKPQDALDLRLLFYGLAYSEDFSAYLTKKQTGLLYPSVKEDAILAYEISYPTSIQQQRCVVSLLDEAFAGLATAKANAEMNLENARALFESNLQSVFTQHGKGWMKKPLRAICDFSQGVQVDVKLQSDIRKDQSQVRFLRIVDFTQGNDPVRFIYNPGDKFLVCQSDISLVRYGASTGFVCRGLEGAIANNLFRVIPKDGHVSNDFLYWFLKSPVFQDEIKIIMNGAAMPAISFGAINEIAVAFPPQQEQSAIVSKLDSLAEETQRLARLYEQKIAAVEALKKSLLHQAFSGGL